MPSATSTKGTGTITLHSETIVTVPSELENRLSVFYNEVEKKFGGITNHSYETEGELHKIKFTIPSEFSTESNPNGSAGKAKELNICVRVTASTISPIVSVSMVGEHEHLTTRDWLQMRNCAAGERFLNVIETWFPEGKGMLTFDYDADEAK